ncbi:MAG: hypothetical protein SH868_05890 [Bythopirellula sp.]|nr:hypothetical protein [Bythopirellula sp.]
MEPVLLGLAAPSAVNTAGNLLERTFNTLAEPFSAVLHAVADSLSAASDEQPAVPIADMQTALPELQQNLATRIEQALASAGVELTEPLQLRISAIDGRLEVVGEHPQKALIESALADDPELAQDFSLAVAIQQLLLAEEPEDDVALGAASDNSLTAQFTSDETGASLTLN